jgi:hypothetical protein
MALWVFQLFGMFIGLVGSFSLLGPQEQSTAGGLRPLPLDLQRPIEIEGRR